MLIGALALLLTGGPAAAQTQETNTVSTNPVGNPQLRDFDLPGTRTTPPAPPPETTTPPATIAAPPVPPPQADPDTATPAPRSRPRAAAPVPRRTPAPNAAPAPAVPPKAPAPAPQGVGEAPPIPAPAVPAAEPRAERAPAPALAGRDIPWLYIGLGALAALVALLIFLKVRRRPAAEEEPQYIYEASEAAAEPQREAVPAKAPQPAPAAAPAQAFKPTAAPASDVVGIQMRPWVELEFKPARAAATLTEANVQFELTVRNTGTAPARNVRIEVRMFNAGHGQEQEIEAFYGEPIRDRTPPVLEALPAKGEVQVTSAVAMPNENVRELTVQGRRLFIPTVAFNVVYDWGNGRSGQTSASYLVGREAETPTDKMGAFRLDLGPRLYRSVGQRPMRLARTV